MRAAHDAGRSLAQLVADLADDTLAGTGMDRRERPRAAGTAA